MAKYGLNQVTLIGNLGKDPELRYLDQGIALVSLRLACTERFRDKTGNYVDRTEWVSVNLWRSQAEIVAKYCRKGSTICIEGRIISRSWETAEGEKRSRTEVEGRRVVLLDSAPSPLSTPQATQQVGTIAPNPLPEGGAAIQNPLEKNTPMGGEGHTAQPTGQTPTSDEDLDDLPF